MNTLLNRYRRYLANYESVLAYSVLGIVGGVASGLVVLAFELAINGLASAWRWPSIWGAAAALVDGYRWRGL